MYDKHLPVYPGEFDSADVDVEDRVATLEDAAANLEDMAATAEQLKAMSPREREIRRSDVVDGLARLRSFPRLTRSQQRELDDMGNELMALDTLATRDEIQRAGQREDLKRRVFDGSAAFEDGGPGGAGGRRTDPTVISRARKVAFDGLERCQSLTRLDGTDLVRRAEASLQLLSERGVPQEGTDMLGRFFDPYDLEEGAPPIDWQQAQRSQAAQLVVAASSPVYERAFRKLLRNPSGDRSLFLTDEERAAVQRTMSLTQSVAAGDRSLSWGDDHVQRAAMSLTNAAGGYLVPFTLDPTIVLSNAGSANPWRQVATRKTTTTNTWNGVTSAGMNAAWYAEAAVVADNSPTFGNIQITPQRASAWAFGSVEVLEDSDFEEQLPNLLADAKDRLESTAFAVGTGSGQPFGAITRATATAIGGGLITVAGLQTVHQALSPRFRNARPVWLGNVTALDAMRILPAYTNGPPVLQGNNMALWGETAYEASDMDGTIAVGGHKVVCYMDGNQYYVVDRIGMTVIHEPLVKDVTTGRPTGQAGWFALWRTGADATFGASSAAIRVLSLT